MSEVTWLIGHMTAVSLLPSASPFTASSSLSSAGSAPADSNPTKPLFSLLITSDYCLNLMIECQKFCQRPASHEQSVICL